MVIQKMLVGDEWWLEDIDVDVDVLKDVEYCNAPEDVDIVVGVKLVWGVILRCRRCRRKCKPRQWVKFVSSLVVASCWNLRFRLPN